MRYSPISEGDNHATLLRDGALGMTSAIDSSNRPTYNKVMAHHAVTIADLLGKGGEATVYQIAEQPDTVAKLYHQPTAMREAKVRAMVANPPEQPQTHTAIAWPTALLYQKNNQIYATSDEQSFQIPHDGDFVGFLMPKVTASQALFKAYNPRLRQQTFPEFSWLALHRVAYNLAIAVQAIHTKGYVIGDLNESNILVNQQALVTLVDTDSFQVQDKQGQVYRCNVGKPEYTPPELQGVDFKQVDQTKAHDLFGLGVLLFQLLMQGFHPFAGVLAGNLSVGRVDLYGIRQGVFPYHPKSEMAPPPAAPPFNMLYPMLQKAFQRCFMQGHHQPHLRPTAAEWQQMLHHAEVALVSCKVNPQHVYANHSTECPWCVAERQLITPRPSKRFSQPSIKKQSSYQTQANPISAQPPKPTSSYLPQFDAEAFKESASIYLELILAGVALIFLGSGAVVLIPMITAFALYMIYNILAYMVSVRRFIVLDFAILVIFYVVIRQMINDGVPQSIKQFVTPIWSKILSEFKLVWQDYQNYRQFKMFAQRHQATIVAMWVEGQIDEKQTYYIVYEYSNGLRVREKIDYFSYYTAIKVGNTVDTYFHPPNLARLVRDN